MTRRENSKRRRNAHKEEKIQVLIVCGGKATEPKYFRGLKSKFRNPAIRFNIDPQGTDPKKLVEHASTLNIRGDFDELWCVLDVDEYDLTSTVIAARKSNVRLAVSNPCFEYWLLLHFEDCSAPLTCYEEAARRLKRHIADYNKSELRFNDFTDNVSHAVRRAKQRCPEAGKHEHQHNPSTRVWELVERMQP